MNPTHGSTLPRKKHLAWSRIACMLLSRSPSPRTAPSYTLSALNVPVSPSPARRDASRPLWRSFQHSAAPGLYLPASSCWHPLSVRKYIVGICCTFCGGNKRGEHLVFCSPQSHYQSVEHCLQFMKNPATYATQTEIVAANQLIIDEHYYSTCGTQHLLTTNNSFARTSV